MTKHDAIWELDDLENEMAYTMWSQFLSGKYPEQQPWIFLPFMQIKFLWQQYIMHGMVKRHHEEAINKIAERTVRNIIKLWVNTDVCGHTPGQSRFVTEDLENYGIICYESEQQEEDFIDWIYDISDYGFPKLYELAIEITMAETAERKLQLVDQVFQVDHGRGSMAGYFLKNGLNAYVELAEIENIYVVA